MIRDSGCIIRQGTVRTSAQHGGTRVGIARIVATGGSPGPTLTITAAQHGRELNGVEAARRVVEWLDGRKLSGTVQVFPVVNPPAVRAASQTVPGEKQNPNRIWPGDRNGTATERIAAAIAPYIAKSDYLVDLHGWSDWTVSTALVGRADDSAAVAMARAFGLEFVYCNLDGHHAGNLKTFAEGCGITCIGVELTPQWRIRSESVESGLRGLVNVLRHLRMLSGRPQRPKRQWLYTAATPRRSIRAGTDGLYVQKVRPGTPVRKNRLLGCLYRTDTLRLAQEVRAPISGVVINIGPCRNAVECNVVLQGAMLAEVWKADPLT